MISKLYTVMVQTTAARTDGNREPTCTVIDMLPRRLARATAQLCLHLFTGYVVLLYALILLKPTKTDDDELKGCMCDMSW